MWHSSEIRFGLDHPTAAGHFPGNPIIPGATLLDEVIAAIADGPLARIVIRSTKFLQPVRPGDVLELRWQLRDDGEIAFECRLRDPDRVALAGTVRMEPASP
jgi:3-hydroxyacyl-[acyl-carrier-protein] dehydratase